MVQSYSSNKGLRYKGVRNRAALVWYLIHCKEGVVECIPKLFYTIYLTPFLLYNIMCSVSTHVKLFSTTLKAHLIGLSNSLFN